MCYAYTELATPRIGTLDLSMQRWEPYRLSYSQVQWMDGKKTNWWVKTRLKEIKWGEKRVLFYVL